MAVIPQSDEFRFRIQSFVIPSLKRRSIQTIFILNIYNGNVGKSGFLPNANPRCGWSALVGATGVCIVHSLHAIVEAIRSAVIIGGHGLGGGAIGALQECEPFKAAVYAGGGGRHHRAPTTRAFPVAGMQPCRCGRQAILA